MSVDLLQAIQAEKQRRSQGENLSANGIKESGQIDLIDAIQMEKQRRAQEQESAPFYQPALDVVSEVGETIDAYTGAPTRAAIEEVVQGRGVGDALGRFGEQFGEDPSLAPTGKQLAVQMGASAEKSLADISPGLPDFLDPRTDVNEELRERGFTIEEPESKLIEKGDMLDISQAGAAGTAIDVLADPLNLVPFGLAYKGAKAGIKGVLGGAKTAAKGAGKVAKAKIVTPILKNSSLADDIASGSKTLSDAVAGSSKNIKKAVDNLLNPRIADDYQDFIEISNKFGIDVENLPETVKYGAESTPGKMAKVIAQGPVGDDKKLQFVSSLIDTSKKTDEVISSIGNGAKLDNYQAGKALKESYDNAVDTLFNNMDITYKNIQTQVPGFKITENAMKKFNSKLNGIEKAMKGKIARGVGQEVSQAKEILRNIQNIRKSKNNYKQFVETMQSIGNAGYGGKVNFDSRGLALNKKALRDLYDSMKNTVIDTTRESLGDDLANTLIENNKKMTQFFSDTKNMRKTLESEKAFEKMYQTVFKNGDSLEIEKLRRILDKDTFDALRSKYLNDVILKNDDGIINFVSLKRNLQKDKLLPHLLTESELADISELARLGKRIGSPVLNTSGTEVSSAFRHLKDTIRAAIENETVLETLKNRANQAPIREARKAARAAQRASRPAGSGAIMNFLDSPRTRAGAAGARAISTDQRNEDRESLSSILRGQ